MNLHVAAPDAYYMYIHVLMRDEKEGRKKQGQTNNKAIKETKHTQGSHFS